MNENEETLKLALNRISALENAVDMLASRSYYHSTSLPTPPNDHYVCYYCLGHSSQIKNIKHESSCLYMEAQYIRFATKK